MSLKSNLNESKNPWETLVLLLQQQKMMMIHAVFSAKQDCQPPQSFIPINATSCFHAALKSNTMCWNDLERSIQNFFRFIPEKYKHTCPVLSGAAAAMGFGPKKIKLLVFPVLNKVSFVLEIPLKNPVYNKIASITTIHYSKNQFLIHT